MSEPKLLLDINQLLATLSQSAFQEILISNTACFQVTLQTLVTSMEKSELYSIEIENSSANASLESLNALKGKDFGTTAKLAGILVGIGKKLLQEYQEAEQDQVLLLLWSFRVTKLFDAYVEIVTATFKYLNQDNPELKDLL